MTSTDRLDEFGNGNKMLMAKGVDGGIGKEDNFFHTGKVLMIGFLLFLLGMVVLMWNVKGARQGFLLLIGWFVVTFFATRYVIFEEKKFLNLFKTCDYGNARTCGVFDGVLRISGSESAGAIMTMASGDLGMCIEVVRGSIVGKGEDFRVRYLDTMSDGLHSLQRKGYRVVIRKVMINCREDGRLKELSKLPESISNPALHQLMADEIGYTMAISAEVKYEREYWFVYCHKAGGDAELVDDCTRFVNIVRSVAPGTHLCDKADLVRLNREEFGCNGANLSVDNASNLEIEGTQQRLLHDSGLHLVGVGIGDFRVGVAETDASVKVFLEKKEKDAKLYKGAYSGNILKAGELSFRQHLQVSDLERVAFDGATEEVSNHKAGALKSAIYKNYINDTEQYKREAASRIAEIDWGDLDDQ